MKNTKKQTPLTESLPGSNKSGVNVQEEHPTNQQVSNIQLSENHFRDVADNAPEAIITVTGEGIILYWNHTAAKLFGYSKDEALQGSIKMIIPDRFHATHGAELSKILSEGINKHVGQTKEFIAQRKNGQEVPVELSLTVSTSEGHALYTAVIRDRTEFKQIEETLTEKTAFLDSILRSTNDISIVATDSNFVIKYYNPVAEKIFGYTSDQVVGKKVMEIHTKEEMDHAKFENAVEIVKKEGEYKYNGISETENDVRHIASRATGISDSFGDLKGFVLVSRDVTESVKAKETQEQLLQELQKANEELKDFAYIVSHDLKAPLRAITILSEWLLADYADKLDDEGKERIGILVSRSKRMQDMINAILNYSRIGKVEDEVKTFDLNVMVNEVIAMIAPPENISVQIDSKLPCIKCEEMRIGQIFQNLISNAIKYNDKSDGRVSIKCLEDAAFWVFSVSDNGLGIEERNFKRIFQIFQTLVARDEIESTGIGLTVVKKIVELYGGKVWIESKVGEGSTFYFSLRKSLTAT